MSTTLESYSNVSDTYGFELWARSRVRKNVCTAIGTNLPHIKKEQEDFLQIYK